MSVEQEDVIDAIGIDQAGMVTLAISDHLDWSEENEHLVLLQNKINTYLRFLESGEILENYPQAKGKPCSIEIVGKHDLCEPAQAFLQQAKLVLDDAGFGLRFRKLVSGD
jgi:hypothetical protein